MPEFKPSLLEEIFICTQYLKGFTYSDVLNLPIYERRYYSSLLTKQARQREEEYEELKNKSSGKSGRTTKISGEALKSKLKSGEIPNN